MIVIETPWSESELADLDSDKYPASYHVKPWSGYVERRSGQERPERRAQVFEAELDVEQPGLDVAMVPDRAEMMRRVLCLVDGETTEELMAKWIRCMARGTASDEDVRTVIALVRMRLGRAA